MVGRSSKQAWEVGEMVKVGFISGLEVVAKCPTPGDYAPDAYVLYQGKTDRHYRFVPHRGIERRMSCADAMKA